MGHRVIWQRAKDYVARYQPLIISVTGTAHKHAVAQAIGLILKGERTVYVPQVPHETPYDVALGILGVSKPADHPKWFQLLARSLVREIVEEEANTLVLEISARQPGDIDWLAKQLPYQIAVVTDVGTARTEIFDTKEMLAHEMTSLIATLPKEGTAVLFADDPLVSGMAVRTSANVVTFGQGFGADVRLLRIQRLSHGGFAGEVVVGGIVRDIHLRHVINRSQAIAILSALAVARIVGVDSDTAISRLQSFVPPVGHSKLVAGIHGCRVIDESHDASFESMLAALETLRSMPDNERREDESSRFRFAGSSIVARKPNTATRRIAVLGDITDLGHESYRVHKQIGKLAAEVAQVVVLVGEEMRHAGAEAIFHGADVHHFNKAQDVGKWLGDFLNSRDLVVVCGSKKMQMGEVLKRIGINLQE